MLLQTSTISTFHSLSLSRSESGSNKRIFEFAHTGPRYSSQFFLIFWDLTVMNIQIFRLQIVWIAWPLNRRSPLHQLTIISFVGLFAMGLIEVRCWVENHYFDIFLHPASPRGHRNLHNLFEFCLWLWRRSILNSKWVKMKFFAD